MNYLGNISLLDQPKHGFLCSRYTKSSVILPSLDWAVECAHGDTVVMSTFHSEIEEAVLNILLSGSCPLILVLGRSIYKKVPENLRLELESGRLLIISVSDQNRISLESALLANQYICQNSNKLSFGFLSPESSLYPLYEVALKSDLEVNVLCK